MTAPSPQRAEGKILWHFSMTLDGFVAGPDHSMDWMTGFTGRNGLVEEYVATLGAVLGGRTGWDVGVERGWEPYGGLWQGPVFVLTHHPEDAAARDGVTFLSCPLEEAVEIARTAAGGKNVEVHSPSIGRHFLERGLIDEIDLHVAPVLLGDGVRLYDNPGGVPIRLHQPEAADPLAEVDLRYRPWV